MVHICPVGAREGQRPCIHCKGPHKEQDCPLYKRALDMYRVKTKVKESFSGAAPTPFIGRFGYPNINVGILTPPDVTEQAWRYDAPKHWSHTQIAIPEIVELRTALVNSRTEVNIKNPSKMQQLAQEVAMASKPVEVEINLEKLPYFNLKFDHTAAPFGPTGSIKTAEITANPKVPIKIEKAVADTDLKATQAITELFQHGFDENYLTKLLSTASLGIGKSRRLVPTRWSITATDDIISKDLLTQIKDYPPINDFLAFTGEYFGNYYLVLLFPEIWSYELFENYVPGWKSGSVRWSTDYEPYRGRTNYAEQCAGGYYTVKLAVLEYLTKIKRQATALVLRFVTEEYTTPLGVWVTREATRKAMNNKPITFQNKELVLQYAKNYIQRKFGLNCHPIYQTSKIIDNFKQTKLSFFSTNNH